MNSRFEVFFLSMVLIPFFSLLQACDAGNSDSRELILPAMVDSLKVEIIQTYPHDPRAYTQGLLWEKGWIYESTGRNGQSGIRAYKPGEPPDSVRAVLPREFFGEGLAKIGSRFFMLTWRAGKVFVFESGTFEQTGEFSYNGEGWGLCHDGRWLIMSNGSDQLTYRDPANFNAWKTLQVRMGGEPVYYLNELEFAGGYIYANVWQRNYLVKIDPASGNVVGVIDASMLPYKSRMAGEDVLNGISYIPERDTFLLTGKLWPDIYEVRIVNDK
jgi:glutaminyl-peptide cyclotransferase